MSYVVLDSCIVKCRASFGGGGGGGGGHSLPLARISPPPPPPPELVNTAWGVRARLVMPPQAF